MIQLNTGVNQLRLTLQSPQALASVTLRLTSQTTGHQVVASVLSPAYNGRIFSGSISINTPPFSASSLDLSGPDTPQGFYLAELRAGSATMATTLAYLETDPGPTVYDAPATYLAYQ